MKVEIKVPTAGESVTEANISLFLKKTGDSVQLDDEIIELETEKVNQVLYSPGAGQISWNVKEGDTVQVGQVIGYVDTDVSESAAPKSEEPAAKAPETPKAAPQEEKASKSESKVRLFTEDFVADIKSPTPSAPSPSAAPSQAKAPIPKQDDNQRETRTPMSKIRKVIAKRLVEASNSTAMLTTFNEVDMKAVIKLRKRHKESFEKEHGVKLGFMSFFVKAVVAALKAFPDLNSYIDGEDIMRRNYYDISIAISTERGLIVPVIRNCDSLGFADIEKAIIDFSTRAKKGRLTLDELSGGSFTITNGGIFGSTLSTPILNPPQSGILGMHNIIERPVAINGKVEIRPIMYLALSYDHRIVDGKNSIQFLLHIAKSITDPACLLIDL